MCALQNSYLSICLCPGQRVSQTGRLQGQKGAAASPLSVQLEGKKKKREGGASQKAAGQGDCTRAEQTFHVVIQHTRSLLPPQQQIPLGGLH